MNAHNQKTTEHRGVVLQRFVSFMLRRKRIKQIDGYYYPQWSLPLLPIWVDYHNMTLQSIRFDYLEDARKFLQPTKTITRVFYS